MPEASTLVGFVHTTGHDLELPFRRQQRTILRYDLLLFSGPLPCIGTSSNTHPIAFLSIALCLPITVKSVL